MYRTHIYHLMCIGATLAFLSSLQTSGSDSIFLLIPLGTQIGIILALGIRECASIAWRGTQGVLLSLLDGLRSYGRARHPASPIPGSSTNHQFGIQTRFSMERDSVIMVSINKSFSLLLYGVFEIDGCSVENPWRSCQKYEA